MTDIVVVLNDQPDKPAISCSSDGKKIYVKKAFLERASSFDTTSTRTTWNRNGEVTFQGTTPNLFRLAGVEEGHHAVFRQTKPEVANHNTRTMTSADYDADEAEYRALKWKIRYAEEQHMPEMTTNILKEQLAKAAPIREQRMSLSRGLWCAL